MPYGNTLNMEHVIIIIIIIETFVGHTRTAASGGMASCASSWEIIVVCGLRGAASG